MSEKNQNKVDPEKVRDMMVYAGYNTMIAHPEQILFALIIGATANKVTLGEILDDYEKLVGMINERMWILEGKYKPKER
jgi:hypothetical protein